METPEQKKVHMWFTGNDKRKSNTDQVVQVQQVRTGRRHESESVLSSDSILSEQSSSSRRRRLRQGEFYFYIIVLQAKSLILLWEQRDWKLNSLWTTDNKLIFNENRCVCYFLLPRLWLNTFLVTLLSSVSVMLLISQTDSSPEYNSGFVLLDWI